MSLMEEITVKNLDHLGIVAGLIDEIGIVEIINQKVGVDNREKITSALYSQYNLKLISNLKG